MKAKVEKKVNLRSYAVSTEDGRVLRCNKRHLRLTKEKITPVHEELPESPLPTQQSSPVSSSYAFWASETNIFRASKSPAVAVPQPRQDDTSRAHKNRRRRCHKERKGYKTTSTFQIKKKHGRVS